MSVLPYSVKRACPWHLAELITLYTSNQKLSDFRINLSYPFQYCMLSLNYFPQMVEAYDDIFTL
jgi:hypothetical protein